MKKLFYIFCKIPCNKLRLGFIFLVLLFPIYASANFDANLYYGISGNKVKELQEFLTSEKVYSGPITGNFYSLTLKAVKTFQAREKIFPVAGYFGPKTRLKANAILDAKAAETKAKEAAEAENKPATPESTDVFAPKIKGCADNTAINYNPKAEENDGTCKHSSLILSNYNAGDSNVNEFYKIEAAGENFEMEEFVFLQNRTFRSMQFIFFEKNGNPLGDDKEWLSAGINCNEFVNPAVPQKCQENSGYKFYVNKELGGEKSELTIPKDGYVLMRAITARSSKMGRDIIQIISMKFKGVASGKIITAP